MTFYYFFFFKFGAQLANFVMLILGKNRRDLSFQVTFLVIRPGHIATWWCTLA